MKHEGKGCRRHQQHRQFRRTLLFRLDADRDRRDRTLLRHPLGAWIVEPAMAAVPVVDRRRCQLFRSRQHLTALLRIPLNPHFGVSRTLWLKQSVLRHKIADD